MMAMYVCAEHPSLVRSSSEKVSSVGDTVVFECLLSSHRSSYSPVGATGSSSAQLARVDWLKDGMPIVADTRPSARRRYLIADSQVEQIFDDFTFTL